MASGIEHLPRTAGAGRRARIVRAELVGMLVVVPAAGAIATVLVSLTDSGLRPDHGRQLTVGLAAAAVVWLVATLLFGRTFVDVETASAESYEELRVRVLRVEARLGALQTPRGQEGVAALAEARAIVAELKRELHLGSEEATPAGSPFRWLLGHGYVNAWRDLHRAEDLLLAVEPEEVVYAKALTNVERVARPAGRRLEPQLASELRALTGNPKDGIAGHRFVVAQINEMWARSVVREASYGIHRIENDSWLALVNLRNRLVATLVAATVVTYGVVALAVLSGVPDAALRAGVAFFLVGAAVGVFAELYATSRRRQGIVFDYGLAYVRLLVTPVLSGLAGVLGVLVTTFLAAGPGDTPTLARTFDLAEYPTALVLAAVFGLSPGLVLTRLRARADSFEKEIAQLTDPRRGADDDA